MRRFIRRRPSPAMIVAVIALVVALGGTAVAAGTISLKDLTKSAKKKTVGVGKLTYVTVQQSYTGSNPQDGYVLAANCPSGLHPLGGGTKLLSAYAPNFDFFLVEDHLTAVGFTSRFYAGSGGGTPRTDTVAVTVSCGVSQAVTGSPPSS